MASSWIALLALALAAVAQDAQPVVFTRDVAPILFQHCASCHIPGGPAPFSVLTYGDVRPRAAQIARAVRRGSMPPWKPLQGFGGPFAGERRLSSAEVEVITRWAADGALPGVARDLPASPPASDGWQLGTPDLVVQLQQPYRLPGSGPDTFRNFAIAVPNTDVVNVRAVELRPGNPRVSHHATIRVDGTRGSRQLDERDPLPGFTGVMAPGARYPDGHVLVWAPGQVPVAPPPEWAWPLETGSDLVVQMHLVPTGRDEEVTFSVGLYLTPTPVDRPALATLRLGRQDIDIKWGDADYRAVDSFELPVDVDVYGIQPHAHRLGREVRCIAELPDGTRRWLIRIDDWSFDWQDAYRYEQPVRLPKGTIIRAEFRYDNSVSNRNRRGDGQRVRFGERTSDEMGFVWLQVLAHSRADLQALLREAQPRERRSDLIGLQAQIEASPEDVSLRQNAAGTLMLLGRTQDALAQAGEAVRLQPESDVTRYNLGTVLAAAGDHEAAAVEFAHAVALNPGDASAWNSLGAARLAVGRRDEAIEHFRRAASVDPRNFRARQNLGVALEQDGRLDEAIQVFTDLTRDRPSDADTHYYLGTAFELSGQLAAAEAAYKRSSDLNAGDGRAALRLKHVLERQGR